MAAAPMFSSTRASLVVPWDRNNPRLVGEQPRERDLSGCLLLPFRDGGQQVNQGLIDLPGLYCETRDAAPQIGAVEGRALVDFPGEESLS